MRSNISVGFFGKLPCNGDFLERRIPRDFLDVWDPWLQACVHESRQTLQENWLPRYLSGPMWRFVLSGSVCGSGAYAGILVPSVDKVGRYFPLSIVTQIDLDSNPLEFATRRGDWFAALETAAVSALELDNLDLEWFDDRVMECAAQLDGSFVATDVDLDELFAASGFPAQGGDWRVPLKSAGSLQSAINAYAHRELQTQLRPLCIWWTEGSGDMPPSWLALRGLPGPKHFAAMLDGGWERDGWHSLGELHTVQTAAPALHASAAAEPAVETDPLPPPRVTHPEVQLSAIEENRAAFILRADIGLWAVAAAPENQVPDAVRMVADALQQLAPSANLSTAVEALRATLDEVQRRLRHVATRDVQRLEAQANLVAMLISGNECALLSAGEAQKLRIRARVVEQFADAEEVGAPPDSGSLMDLLSADADAVQRLGSAAFKGPRIQYERLQREDLWILCARAPISARNLDYVVGAAASGLPINSKVVSDMIASGGAPGALIPLMTLEL